MPAKYKLVRNPNPRKDGIVQPYHARFVPLTTISTDELIRQIKEFSSFSAADIKGVLELFKNALVINLTHGSNVQLEGLGTFSLSLSCPPETDKKKIDTRHVHFRDVQFRASAVLKKELKKIDFYRAEEAPVSTLTKEDRKERLLAYLEDNRYITAKKYCQLNGIAKTSGNKELNEWIGEGLITREGKGSTTFYMPVTDRRE